jgi:hypothetical protein
VPGGKWRVSAVGAGAIQVSGVRRRSSKFQVSSSKFDAERTIMITIRITITTRQIPGHNSIPSYSYS